MPFAFLWLEIKSICMEALENISDMLAMRGEVGGVDEYVVKVDHDTHIQHICKDTVDETLEHGMGISETKGHYQPLKGAIVVGSG